MLLYCAADLIWATRIRAAAEGVGVPARPVRDAAMLEARLGEPGAEGIRGLVVDLEAPTALEVITRARALRPAGTLHVLAFGPHVAAEAFEQARRVGADTVMARGALDRRLAEILRGLEHPA